ncbi:MAG: PIN domain-containing protein [Pseudonocardiaceae bacterium]
MIADRAEADRRIGVNDLWIAASAAAHHLLVITHDNDFDLVEGVAGLTVVRV